MPNKYFSGFLPELKVWKQGEHSRPHKFILLLTIANLITNESSHPNRFTFEEIEPLFEIQFNELYPEYPYMKSLEYPFYHLKNDGIWQLIIKKGKESEYAKYETLRFTRKRLLETVDYASLDEQIFEKLHDAKFSVLFKQDILYRIEEDQFQYDINATLDTSVQTSLFEHEQEAINSIAKYVKSKNIGKLITNIYIHDKQSNNYFEYDIILIGHSTVYVIELKHWSGRVKVSPNNWLVNTQFRSDPHKNNGFKCRILKGLYQHQFRTYPDIWVESVVVLTNPSAIVEDAASPTKAAESGIHNPTFASVEDFLRYAQRREANIGQVLNNNQIDTIFNSLRELAKPKLGIKYRVPGYETLEYLSQKPNCIELLARPTGAKARGLNRFRIFRVPLEANLEQKQRFIKIARNTMETVNHMGDHPNIHRVWFIENEQGDFIEGSEWSEIGTLRDCMIAQNTQIPCSEALHICAGVALGLKYAHDHGIIHRSVKPENILMFNGVPKLLNFDLAYQIEDEHLTVIEDPTKLKDDGYIAPEMLVGKDIDEGTDFFSLGVIAYELVTGEKPFKSTREFVAYGGELNAQKTDKLLAAGLHPDTIDVIKSMVVANRHLRLKDDDLIIESISAGIDLPVDEEIQILNKSLAIGETYDVYEIVKMIGQGAEAQIYLARTARLDEVVLKLFNTEIPKERIFREAEITSLINSAYVVHCDNKYGHWKNDRYFIVLDYIDAHSMRWFINQAERPSVEQFRSVAISLMEGIEAFHRYKGADGDSRILLHSDIKPENIMITADNKPILIDLGLAGEPRVDWFQGTLDYIPPDNILGIDVQYSEDGDLFALGISLWEWFFGIRPYDKPAIGSIPSLPDNFELLDEQFLHWLQKAVATTKDARFLTIEDMRQSFFSETAFDEPISIISNKKPDDPILPPVQLTPSPHYGDGIETNTFVTYLNTLSNASAANENATAESQIGNADFERIRVDNPVTGLIFNQLFEENRNVILTGNAGDGKTTIAAEILQQKTGLISKLNTREEIDGLTIIKDMSELPQDIRPQIFREALENPDKRFLIVSNTGTLIENFLKIDFGPNHISESELLESLEAERPSMILNDLFVLVNLGRINSIEAAIKVFERMIEPSNWTMCDTCPRNDICPIKISIGLLQENQATVAERVRWLYRRQYEYGNRLTMRQMTGHLAYAITGGLSCRIIHQMGIIQLTERFDEYMFHNRFFGDDGAEVVPEAIQLLPIRHLQKAELGLFLQPKTERSLERDYGTISLSSGLKSLIGKIRGIGHGDMTSRRQIRRLLYFFMSNDQAYSLSFLAGFLKSPKLIDFMRYVDGGVIPPLEEDRLRKLIIQVLQEQWAGIRLPEGQYKMSDLYITMRPPQGFAATQIILCKLKSDDFKLGINTLNEVGELKNNQLVLRLKDDDSTELILDLPFLDFVARRYQGEIAEQISSFYEDRLDLFKAMLLDKKGNNEEDSLTLLKVGSTESFQVLNIRMTDDALEVLQ